MLLVKDAMTQNPECVQSNDLVTKARSIMRNHGYRALPVIENKHLVGIITRGDVLRITSTKTNIEVRGVMNRNVITVSPDDDLFEAARTLTQAGVRQLLVTKNSTLVGILSTMDILDSFLARSHKPRRENIRDVMTTKVEFCSPEDQLSAIWARMEKEGFDGFPVVKRKKVIGMITRMDILKERSIRLSLESGKKRSIPVEKVMQTPAITTTLEAGVEEIASIMVEDQIIKIPVLDDNEHLVGMVDVEDILRAYSG